MAGSNIEMGWLLSGADLSDCGDVAPVELAVEVMLDGLRTGQAVVDGGIVGGWFQIRHTSVVAQNVGRPARSLVREIA